MERSQGIKLELLIFDFDGTLFDLDVDWGSLRQKLGLTNSDKGLGDLMQKYVSEGHPDLEHVSRAELAAVAGKRLRSEILDTLCVLANSFPLAILTRNSRQAVEAVLAKTDLGDHMYIVGREDVRGLKPDPEGLYKILRHFEQEPSRTALIGDTFHDVETAHAAGVFSIIVRNAHLAYTPQGADLYIEDVKSLPGELL